MPQSPPLPDEYVNQLWMGVTKAGHSDSRREIQIDSAVRSLKPGAPAMRKADIGPSETGKEMVRVVDVVCRCQGGYPSTVFRAS